MNSNISISSLSNKSVSKNSISVRSILNTVDVNKNSLFDNTYRTEKINSHSKKIIDDIKNNNAEKNKIKEQLYNKIYEICLNQIQNNYKVNNEIIFEVPKQYMNVNYNWIECLKYIVVNLKKNEFDLKRKDNFIRISWKKFNKNFE